MHNGNELHYIASGLDHIRLGATYNDDMTNWVRNHFKSMSTDDCQFGILYNAFTEAKFGELFHKTYNDVVCDIHADSGGLQMMTIGKVADDLMKDKIYENQSKFSTIAMSFDEIPVEKQSNNTKSAMANSVDRLFRRDLVYERAKKSGENLAKQLKYFDKVGTKSKPMLIAQGNDIDSFCEWVEVVQQQIPQSLINNIGGIAMSSASLGGGDLENIESAFAFTQLPIKFECKQLHLLGVGVFNRMLPTMVMAKNGMYQNLVISFDSTTHTGDINRGTVYLKNQYGNYSKVDVPRAYKHKTYERVMNALRSCDVGYDDPRKLYEYYVTLNGTQKLTDAGRIDEYDTYVKTLFSMFKVSYDSFAEQLGVYMRSPDPTLFVKSNLQQPIRYLYNSVKTQDDFLYWKRNFARFIQTKRVNSEQPLALEGLDDD